MVSAAVTGNQFLVVNANTDTKNADTKSSDNSFNDIISSVQKENTSTQDNVQGQPSGKAEEIKNLFNKDSVKVPQSESEISDEDNIIAMSDMITDIIKNIVEAVAEQFDVEPEAVIDAMDELNMSAEDLQSGKELSELITQLTGNENVMNILTDSEMSGQFKGIFSQIQDMVNQFVKDNGITNEDLNTLLNEFDLPKLKEQFVEITDVSNTDVTENVQTSELTDASENIENVAEDSVAVSSDSREVNNLTDKQIQNSESEITPEENAVKVENSTEKQNDVSQNGTQDQSLAQNFNQTLTEIISEKFGEDIDVKPEQIMRQIVEEVKSIIKPDMTSMEMQLNPENLGRINLQVVSKNGSITAQIIAQNEIVKEAIESQVSQLRETLDNQGVKVDAIEVTVGSRQFDENLDNQSDSNDERKQKKHISQEEIDEINGKQTIKDEIEEELMKQDGNTVSIRA